MPVGRYLLLGSLFKPSIAVAMDGAVGLFSVPGGEGFVFFVFDKCGDFRA